MYLRNFGLTQPIAVIPNAIDVAAFTKQKAEPLAKKRKIGFLGRLAPIKNLELLIKAWIHAKATTQHAELIIIGEGDEDYIGELKSLIEKNHINNVVFTGFLTGKAQEDMMQQLSYLVLPSKSENFGMVVSEALARQIPVIASKGTPWEELNTHQCGWWIDSDLESISETLQKALNLDETKRLSMGENGRILVENKYSKEAVSNMMTIFYEWILSDTKELPSFVYIKS
jgi:glycosyltransferase involved in cell wall biosynthesis